MLRSRKSSEAAARATERRRREDEAPRLLARAPKLATLDLAIEERRPGAVSVDARHVRRVVVERAPALFEMPCSDKDCVGGGHDLTREILASLQSGQEHATGEHRCDGTVSGRECGRVLRYTTTATYRP